MTANTFLAKTVPRRAYCRQTGARAGDKTKSWGRKALAKAQADDNRFDLMRFEILLHSENPTSSDDKKLKMEASALLENVYEIKTRQPYSGCDVSSSASFCGGRRLTCFEWQICQCCIWPCLQQILGCAVSSTCSLPTPTKATSTARCSGASSIASKFPRKPPGGLNLGKICWKWLDKYQNMKLG